MSEKKAKQDRKIKMVTEQADPKDVAEEMAKSISKMYEDRDKKAVGAREHLVSQLKVTADKYRTANGVMAALATVRDVIGSHSDMTLDDEMTMAKSVATSMSRITTLMADKAGDLDPEEMDKLCKGFYNEDFSQDDDSAGEMVHELMMLQLCQNVGPDAGDIVDFCKHTDEEIDKARENLKTFCEENDLDFNELCGPHEDCHDCLCESCEKDCKDHKMIEEGQSAYDVCESFVEKE
jgi:hypothetical protein